MLKNKNKKNTEDLPNIVIFVPDEMRGDVITNDIVKIPNIDSIRKDGVTFTNNFSVNPVCGPSRCCTFTGQYPHNGGHRSLYQLLRESDENLFKFLKKKGYEVIWIGRNDLLYKKAAKKSVTKYVSSIKLMIKAYFPVIPHKFKLIKAFKNKSWDIVMKIIDPYMKVNPFSKDDPFYKSFYFGEETKLQADLGMDQLITNEALKYLEKYGKSKKKKPFCLYLPFIYPHPPYKVEEPYFSMYNRNEIPSVFPPETEGIINYDDKSEFMKTLRDLHRWDLLKDKDFREIRAVYYGMISKLDNQIGQILSKLKDVKEYDKSIITFFSDHGDYAGSYGLTEKWPTGMHDCLLNVPLIIKIPGITPVSKNINELTETIDIFPTLLDLANIDTKYTHFGKSLIPIIKGDVKKHRDAVFAEGGYDVREPQAFEKGITADNPLMGIYYDKVNIQNEKPELVCRTTMIRTKDWKLVLRSESGVVEELYDIKNDSNELVNLIMNPDYKDIIKELKDKLLYWYIKTSDNPHWVHKREA